MKLISKTAVTVAALASVALLGAGNASAYTIGGAGAAVTPTPTAGAYQLCGTAYIGADNHVDGAPATAKPVGGVVVTGAMPAYGSFPISWPAWTGNATTAADGSYCINATSAMANSVIAGNTVTVSFDTPSVVDAGTTYTGKMSGSGGVTTGPDYKLNATEFANHAWPNVLTAKSAWKVNVVYN